MRRRIFSTADTSEAFQTAALAPMVDLFTILVVAVLRASSPQAPMELPEKDYQLPISRQEVSVQKGEVIDIGMDGIYVNGTRVTSAKYWQKNEQPVINELKSMLQKISGTKAQIRAHAKAPWEVVDKALFTAQQSGYNDIEMIAISNVSL